MDHKNLDKEIEAVKSNNSLNEKLMIFALYNELYNDILNNIGEDFMKKCLPYIESNFKLAASNLKLGDNMHINAMGFMDIFLALFKKRNKINSTDLESLLIQFNKYMDVFIKNSEYVDVIDKYNSISLDSKVDIMILFREYINDVYLNAIKLYGREETIEFRKDILSYLTSKLDTYLKKCTFKGIKDNDIFGNLSRYLTKTTKNYLMSKYKNNDSDCIITQNKKNKKIVPFFDNLEREIWLMHDVYYIAGYADDIELVKEETEETCQMLGITRSRYVELLSSVATRALEILPNILFGDDMDDDFIIGGK